jgi:hypothetical protein
VILSPTVLPSRDTLALRVTDSRLKRHDAQPASASARRLRLFLALASLVPFSAVAPAWAQGPEPQDTSSPLPVRRGPAEIRDEQLLAQPRLTLPAISPATVAEGHWAVRTAVLWSNSFSWVQDKPGEMPTDRRFLIDGEAFTLDTTIRRGITDRLDVALRVPFRWRGGGVLDGLIDAWHRLWNTPSGHRSDFLEDAFRVEGKLTDGTPFSWNALTGTALGDVETEARWRFLDHGARGVRAAAVGRLSLPTATGPFSGSGMGAGGQVVLDAPVGRAFDLYAGAGFTLQDPGPLHGIEYETARGHGFLALEWRPAAWVSIVGETNAASRLVKNIDSYPGTHWVVNLTGRFDAGSRTRLDVGFTENIISQLTTTDFALYFAVTVSP